VSTVSAERPEAAAPVLSMRGVSKHFGAVAALTDIALDVHAGEVVALVGDNGAGKSTLVKILAGVHPQDAGTVNFDGKDVTIHTPVDSIQLGIATVFQDLALCDNLTVVDNLFLGRELAPWRLNEVEMEVQSWKLLRQLSAKIPSVRIAVASLSGGQRQTVAIARSLLGSPKLIILDEPTAALGVAQTAEVLNLVERLRENGLAVIMISHNMQDVQAVADRVAVLRLGKNNGTFLMKDVSTDDLIAAITGATDNVVTQRAAQTGAAAAASAEGTAAGAEGTAAMADEPSGLGGPGGGSVPPGQASGSADQPGSGAASEEGTAP
jgi:D-xylose transport system ATP-binding protein